MSGAFTHQPALSLLPLLSGSWGGDSGMPTQRDCQRLQHGRHAQLTRLWGASTPWRHALAQRRSTIRTGTPRDAIPCRVDGHPKKGVDGKPIHAKGKTKEESKGISFLHRHNDGTQEHATVIEPRSERLKGDKDCDQFVIKHDRSQVKDVMACNDIMNCLH